MQTPAGLVAAELARVQREDGPRLLATLARRLGDIDLAEDVVQDAAEAALETWPRTGVPASPLAWLFTTARRKAIDRLRRDAVQARRLAELHVEEDRRGSPTPPAGHIPDDRLELFFACCHPTLRPEEQLALTLRFLGGLDTQEVAAAFLVPVPTMQARLTRAKKRIRETRIPVAVPGPELLPERLPVVLRVIESIYTEGYAATSGQTHVRGELTTEAIRLARLALQLVPGSPDTLGLLALLLLTEARTEARTDTDGLPVPLEEQDRNLWSTPLLKEGLALAEEAAAASGASGRLPGAVVIRAAIAAVHGEATHFDQTDWGQLVALYDLLRTVTPSALVDLNRAVAIGRRDGFAAGLALLDALAEVPELQRHHPFHAARAVTLEMLGRERDATDAWLAARDATGATAERTYAERRITRLGGAARLTED